MDSNPSPKRTRNTIPKHFFDIHACDQGKIPRWPLTVSFQFLFLVMHMCRAHCWIPKKHTHTIIRVISPEPLTVPVQLALIFHFSISVNVDIHYIYLSLSPQENSKWGFSPFHPHLWTPKHHVPGRSFSSGERSAATLLSKSCVSERVDAWKVTSLASPIFISAT